MRRIVLFFIIAFFVCTKSIYAQNNLFGVHLAGLADSDFEAAAHLVNSNGGDWGYITLVIPQNDRDKTKWQDIFNKMRRLHLIPIVRLASNPDGAVWRKPSTDDIDSWVEFLNSLNWVVKDRYVILYNEPNHGQEWGGSANAQEYADVSVEFSRKLKAKSPDFFVMLAGFDAAAPQSPPNYIDEEVFLRDALNKQPALFENIDGWSSHSYPNPGFSGSVYATGRNSIYNYQYEIQLLKSLGVTKDLPIFITETGWVHAEGLQYVPSFIGANQVAQNYKTLFSSMLQDSRVQAVTPFVLDYQSDPFSHFSFKKMGSDEYYPQYDEIVSMQKLQGQPIQYTKLHITSNLPSELLQNSTYQIDIVLENQGQSILDGSDGYHIQVDGNTKNSESVVSDFYSFEPTQTQTIHWYLKTKKDIGSYPTTIALYNNKEKVLDLFSYTLNIKPLPELSFQAKVFPKVNPDGNDYQIQIFDEKENLVYKQADLSVKHGTGTLKNIHNIILGEKYRIVLLRPYYLPRQTHAYIKEKDNSVELQAMIPIDFNFDGQFTFTDIATLFTRPSLLKLLLP